MQNISDTQIECRADELLPGDVINRAWYGPCRIIENLPSGRNLRKFVWEPVVDSWRVPNLPGIDYVRNDDVLIAKRLEDSQPAKDDFYTEQMSKLAEVGASLCCYLPGAGNPEKWPGSRCDCKFLPDSFSSLREDYHKLRSFTSETTGCCEVRQAWRALNVLRENATEDAAAWPHRYWIVRWNGTEFRTDNPKPWQRNPNADVFGPFPLTTRP